MSLNQSSIPAYYGPFLVRRKMSEVDFLIQLDRDGKEQVVHHDKLKPYEGDHPPKWVQRAKKRLLSHGNASQ